MIIATRPYRFIYCVVLAIVAVNWVGFLGLVIVVLALGDIKNK